MVKKTDLSSYDNDWYRPTIGANGIKRIAWYYVNLFFFKSAWIPLSGLKIFLLRLFGAKVGSGVVIKPAVNIKYAWKLEIGDHTWIGEEVWIDNLAPVTIGSHCCISQGALLLTGNHNHSRTGFDLFVKPIVLEDGVWVGAQALVCPGVVCRSHSVLSVRSVAMHDLEPYKIYKGSPAIISKERVIV